MKKINIRLTAAAAAVMVAAGSLAVPAFAADKEGISASCGDVVLSARSTRERDGQSMNSKYLLPDSDTYYISEADISWMDDNELMLARNEFYARRGRKFATKSIQDYFNRQAWYVGTINPDDFTSELFNRYEQANVDFIVAYEAKRKEIREKKMEKYDAEAVPVVPGGSAEYPQEYNEVVELYRDAALEDWGEEDYVYSGMNVMAADLPRPEDLGYTYRDLDENGVCELLIGPTDPQYYGEGAVFEIYYMEDGIPAMLASSDEENFFYICEDNTIRRESTQDGQWEIDYFDLQDGELVLKDALIMDESMDAEEPWFLINDTDEYVLDVEGAAEGEEVFAADDYQPISYEDASEMRASYASGSLDLIPFQ